MTQQFALAVADRVETCVFVPAIWMFFNQLQVDVKDIGQ